MTNPHAGERIASLDLIRGVAILGILVINMGGFAGPMAATITPQWNGPSSPADQFAFTLGFVLFEGKMRGLLSLLFGASMELLVTSVEARGGDGDRQQLRRLIWLAVIGYLHFLLLWWGDILFTYAFAGFFVLLLRHLPLKMMVPAALLAFAAWHGAGMAASAPDILADLRYAANASPATEARAITEDRAIFSLTAREELARERGSFLSQISTKLSRDVAFPMIAALMAVGEVVPMMLLGMALCRSGFFSGEWPRKWLWALASGSVGLGGAMTLMLAGLAREAAFAPATLEAVLAYWAAMPHLLVSLGYATLLVLLCGRREIGWIGQRIITVGRLALTNYLYCSLVFTAIFYGWGLGLIGTVGPAAQWWLIAGGWIAMLWLSPWWYRHHGQGPVERLWRRLAGNRI